MRIFAILLFLLPGYLSAGELTFQFIGNMAFRITDGKTSIYSDFPYESGAFGYMKYDPEFLKNDPDSISLITHIHKDHWEQNLFAKSNWKLIGPRAAQDSLDKSRVIPFSSKIEHQGIQIEPIATPHANLEHYSYLVTWNGLRLYFTGDTDSTEQLLSMKNLDVAFVSPWLIAEVAKNKQKIDTRKLVVYHHTADEKIADLQDRLTPKQNESFVVSTDR